MLEYDFVFAGGGLAGLSLAYHMSRSELRDSRILIIDQQLKERNDRTWCFWANQPTLFDEIVYRSWNQLQFKSKAFEKTLDLTDYFYKMIRGLDFYRFTQSQLSRRGNVEFLRGHVDRIKDAGDCVHVWVGNRTYAGQWAFDSRFHLTQLRPDPTRYHSLRQHFKGWVVQTPYAAFETSSATLFDFRTEQKDDVRFFYVLPFSEREALVEYVALHPDDYDRAIKEYIETTLGIRDYRIAAREGGVNPLTDYVLPRRIGERAMAIGTLGGRVKPTSGYAFTRIQHDSAAIVNSLVEYGHPFGVPSDSSYYRLCDSLMLQLMERDGAQAQALFADLFKNNPVERVLRFLDESASPVENLALMASLPPGPFLTALLRKTLRVPQNSPKPREFRGTLRNSGGL